MKKMAIVHPYLKMLLFKTMSPSFIIGGMASIVLGVIKYPGIIASFDIAMAVLAVVFLVVIFPMMRIGMVPAYYPYNYDAMAKFHVFLLVMMWGSLMRIPIFYGAMAYNIEHASVGMSNNYKIQMISKMTNPIGLLAAALLVGFGVFVLFYKDRFVSMRETAIAYTYLKGKYGKHATTDMCLRKLADEKLQNRKVSNESIVAEVLSESLLPVISLEAIEKEKEKQKEDAPPERIRRTARV